jgi:prepilin-type N-terminal cleavage/methylation domain-containing protein
MRKYWKTRARAGMTLPEVLIAVAIGLGIIGLIVGLLSFVMKMFAKETDRLEPREAAQTALSYMHQYIQDAWYYQLANEGQTINFEGPAGKGSCVFNPDAGSLVLTIPKQKDPKNIIPRDLKLFKIDELVDTNGQLRPGVLRLTLEISRPKNHSKGSSLGNFKAVGEILIPCVASRNDGLHQVRVLEPPAALVPNQ